MKITIKNLRYEVRMDKKWGISEGRTYCVQFDQMILVLDLIGFETIPAMAELECIVRVIAKYPQHDFYISFACNSNATIGSGEQFEDAVKVIKQSGLSNLKAFGWQFSSIKLANWQLITINPRFLYRSQLVQNDPDMNFACNKTTPFGVVVNDGYLRSVNTSIRV